MYGTAPTEINTREKDQNYLYTTLVEIQITRIETRKRDKVYGYLKLTGRSKVKDRYRTEQDRH
jgi:hypothetical protein